MKRRYHIKYGNRLYLAYEDTHDSSWTHAVIEAMSFYTNDEADETLDRIKQNTGLYEARVVAESDIALTVENVP